MSAARRVDALLDDDEEEEPWLTGWREFLIGKQDNTAGRRAKALRTVEAPSDGSDCPICLDSAAAAGTTAGVWKEMPCRHRFHEACLEKWLIKDKEKASCPVCRRTLTPPCELDDVLPELRDIIQRNGGKHLLGDNYHGWSVAESRFYRNVVVVDQCLRLAGVLLAEALPQLQERELHLLSAEGLRARIELVEAKLTDAKAALACASGSASNIVTSLRFPVDGAVLRLLPARACVQAADDLQRAGYVHFITATGWLSSLLPHHCVDAQRLAAVADLQAALKEARAGAEVTSAALADGSLRRLTDVLMF